MGDRSLDEASAEVGRSWRRAAWTTTHCLFTSRVSVDEQLCKGGAGLRIRAIDHLRYELLTSSLQRSTNEQFRLKQASFNEASIVGELGGLKYYAWVGTAYMLTSTTATPLFGKLSDLYGRRRFV